LPGQNEKSKAPKSETIAIPGSSFLQSASYDAATFSLTLDFKTGLQEIHKMVYPMTWQAFKEASSHGSFYARQIKGKYPKVSFRTTMRSSDFTKAMKERGHAPTRA
jgi:hypothetical protein